MSRSPQKSTRRSRRAIGLALLVAVFAAPVSAADGTWNVDADGNWGTSSNWLSSIIADGADNTANFTYDFTANRTVTLDSSRTIGNIVFTDPTSSHDLTISGSSTLTLDMTTGVPVINVTQSGRTLTIGSVIAGNDGLRKRGSGSLIFTANNTYSGNTTISGGTLTLSGSSGAITSSGNVSLLTGGTLTLSNTSAANNTNRLGNSTGLIVTGGGTFNFSNDSSNSTFAETLGTLSLSSGAFTLNTTAAGASGTSILTFGNVTRSAGGATVLFSGTGFGNSTRNQVRVTTALSSQNVGNGTAILPWALIQDGSTYNLAIGGAASGNITQLTTYDTTAGTSSWNASVNARPSADFAVGSGGVFVNSLVLDSGIDVTASNAGAAAPRTLTIGSPTQAGLVVQTGGNSTMTGANSANKQFALDFGSREGIFNVIGQLTFSRNNNSAENLLTGTGGITKTGNGTLILGSVTQAFVQDFTGALNLNQGLYAIYAGSNSSFGNSTNAINFNGGNLTVSDTAIRSYGNPLTVNADATLTSDVSSPNPNLTYTFGTLTINNEPNFTIATGASSTGTQALAVGAVTLNSNATFTLTNGTSATTQLSVGAVSNGANTVTVAGNGNLVQTGVWGNGSGGVTLATGYTGLTTFNQTNTYTGATTINGGTLRAGAAVSGQAFGNLSAVTIADVSGAVLDLNSFSQTIGSLAGGGTTGGNVTLGNATLTSGGNNGNTTFAGIISGSGGSMTKSGTGTLILTGTNTYNGSTTISAGTLQIGNGSTTGSISSTANVTNSAALVYNRSNALTVAYAIGGTGTVTQAGNGTTTFTANSSYSGGTTVSAGTLLANNTTGSATGTGSVAVNSGATFGGNGSVTGAISVNAGGTLTPGGTSAIESLAGGALSLLNTSTFRYELNSSVASSVAADLQLVSGNLSLTSVVTLSMSDIAASPVAFANGTIFTLVNYGGSWNSGLFRVAGVDIADGGTFTLGLNTWLLDYNATSGGLNFSGQYTYANYVNLVAVPEPPVVVLLGAAGLAGLVIRRRRMRAVARVA